MKHPRPSRTSIGTQTTRRNRRTFGRHVSIAIAVVVLPVIAGGCSSDDDSSSNSTTSSVSADDSTGVAETGGAVETNAPTDPTVTGETAATTETAESGAPAETAAGGEGGCSAVPAKDVVESIIGSSVLPVEDQGSVGCAYLGDGDNVGVYFEIETDEFAIAQFDTPDPQFATPVEDPGLPPGSFVQSGDFFAKKNGVLYTVSANVTGTEDDDPLATQLMIAWLALVP